MKKFDRLPITDRKEEIQSAAIKLFLEKGFKATTMENIIGNVTLSKGGVYRIYPSTKAILSDIIIAGMRKRNIFYQKRVSEIKKDSDKVDISTVVDVICDGMLLLPEVSALYAEFLIEKRHIAELEALYQEICKESMEETYYLIQQIDINNSLNLDIDKLWRLTELMNTVTLGIAVLNHSDDFERYKKAFSMAVKAILE